jgi:hypothetical protein
MIDTQQDRDPGPLNDRALQRVLTERNYVRASRTHDRVQDAFNRLVLEKHAAQVLRETALEALDDETKLLQDVFAELEHVKRDRIFTGLVGFTFGVLATIVSMRAIGLI